MPPDAWLRDRWQVASTGGLHRTVWAVTPDPPGPAATAMLRALEEQSRA